MVNLTRDDTFDSQTTNEPTSGSTLGTTSENTTGPIAGAAPAAVAPDGPPSSAAPPVPPQQTPNAVEDSPTKDNGTAVEESTGDSHPVEPPAEGASDGRLFEDDLAVQMTAEDAQAIADKAQEMAGWLSQKLQAVYEYVDPAHFQSSRSYHNELGAIIDGYSEAIQMEDGPEKNQELQRLDARAARLGENSAEGTLFGTLGKSASEMEKDYDVIPGPWDELAAILPAAAVGAVGTLATPKAGYMAGTTVLGGTSYLRKRLLERLKRDGDVRGRATLKSRAERGENPTAAELDNEREQWRRREGLNTIFGMPSKGAGGSVLRLIGEPAKDVARRYLDDAPNNDATSHIE